MDALPRRGPPPVEPAHVELVHDPEMGALLYRIVEPELDAAELALLAEARDRLFDSDMPPPHDPEDAARRLGHRIEEIARNDPRLADAARRERIYGRLRRDLLGFGPIDLAVGDPDIEDVSCDGVGVPIYVHHRRLGSLRTNVRFSSARELDRYVVWLAQRSGRHLSRADPLLEATLPGGARLEASLGSQITTRGSTFTIRRFRERGFSPVDLVRLGTASAQVMAYLWLSVEFGQSFMVCGGTASGKTTTLNALLQFVPSGRKVVSIEDTRELDLARENWVPLRTRGASAGRERSGGGAPSGPVDMFDLLTTAMRQRPQFLVVGEVRGREAYTVFQAIATGKSCATTFHADSVRAMVQRMESPPIGLPRALISELPLILLERQVRVGDAPARRIDSVVEIDGLDPDTEEIVASTIFDWEAGSDRFEFTGHSRLLDRLATERGTGPESAMRELARREELLQRWANAPPDTEGRRSFDRGLAAYARDPEGTLGSARDAPGPVAPIDAGRGL